MCSTLRKYTLEMVKVVNFVLCVFYHSFTQEKCQVLGGPVAGRVGLPGTQRREGEKVRDGFAKKGSLLLSSEGCWPGQLSA